MVDPDPHSESDGLLGHLKRAMEHAVCAARCHVALLVGDVERRIQSAVRRAVLLAVLAVAGLIGASFLLVGVARVLDAWLGAGVGHVILGGGILAAVFVAALIGFRGGKK